MALQNRVTPHGLIIADAARGLFMGNRGGRIHDPDTRTLTRRRWASRRWICCLTAFRDRRRTVMGPGYTELFFLDEPTALAAGHRPCFECRHPQAKAFAQSWRQAGNCTHAPRADEMDRILHKQRLAHRPRVALEGLPSGAAVAIEIDGAGLTVFVRDDWLLEWTPAGYRRRFERARLAQGILLTPPSIVAALDAGYRPTWHDSAAAQAAPLWHRTIGE